MTAQETIHAFYTAFAASDAEAMAKLAAMMWKMLTGRAGDNLKIEFKDVTANSATWIAHYPFGPKKRPVVNQIQAKFEFKDGLIIKHTDTFDLHKWAKQALGFSGWLLGGTAFFKKKLNAKTKAQLASYMAKQSS